MTIVFDTINSLRRLTDWNALALRDPQADFELSGPASGVGAKLTWTSDVKLVGKGSWQLVESVPDQSGPFALEDQRRGHDQVTELPLTPTGRGPIQRPRPITQTSTPRTH